MVDIKNTISTLEANEIINESVAQAIESIRTCSIWKVVNVNPNQTVNIECCHIDMVENTSGDVTMASLRGEIAQFSEKKLGIIVDVPYRVNRWGQFRDMVVPEVGDVGTYTPTYDDMRRWFDTGEIAPLPSHVKMKIMNGAGIWEPYIQNDKDTQVDFPTDNTTRIIKSNRTKITITDPLDENGNPVENEAVKIELTGVVIDISSNGTISINAPQTVLNATVQQANIDTELVNVTGDVVAGGISLQNHTHDFPYNAGPTPSTGMTNPPV